MENIDRQQNIFPQESLEGYVSSERIDVEDVLVCYTPENLVNIRAGRNELTVATSMVVARFPDVKLPMNVIQATMNFIQSNPIQTIIDAYGNQLGELTNNSTISVKSRGRVVNNPRWEISPVMARNHANSLAKLQRVTTEINAGGHITGIVMSGEIAPLAYSIDGHLAHYSDYLEERREDLNLENILSPHEKVNSTTHLCRTYKILVEMYRKYGNGFLLAFPELSEKAGVTTEASEGYRELLNNANAQNILTYESPGIGYAINPEFPLEFLISDQVSGVGGNYMRGAFETLIDLMENNSEEFFFSRDNHQQTTYYSIDEIIDTYLDKNQGKNPNELTRALSHLAEKGYLLKRKPVQVGLTQEQFELLEPLVEIIDGAILQHAGFIADGVQYADGFLDAPKAMAAFIERARKKQQHTSQTQIEQRTKSIETISIPRNFREQLLIAITQHPGITIEELSAWFDMPDHLVTFYTDSLVVLGEVILKADAEPEELVQMQQDKKEPQQERQQQLLSDDESTMHAIDRIVEALKRRRKAADEAAEKILERQQRKAQSLAEKENEATARLAERKKQQELRKLQEKQREQKRVEKDGERARKEAVQHRHAATSKKVPPQGDLSTQAPLVLQENGKEIEVFHAEQQIEEQEEKIKIPVAIRVLIEGGMVIALGDNIQIILSDDPKYSLPENFRRRKFAKQVSMPLVYLPILDSQEAYFVVDAHALHYYTSKNGQPIRVEEMGKWKLLMARLRDDIDKVTPEEWQESIKDLPYSNQLMSLEVLKTEADKAFDQYQQSDNDLSNIDEKYRQLIIYFARQKAEVILELYISKKNGTLQNMSPKDRRDKIMEDIRKVFPDSPPVISVQAFGIVPTMFLREAILSELLSKL